MELKMEEINVNNERYITRVFEEMDNCTKEILECSDYSSVQNLQNLDAFLTDITCNSISVHLKNLLSSKILKTEEEAKDWLVIFTNNLRRALKFIADIDVD